MCKLASSGLQKLVMISNDSKNSVSSCVAEQSDIIWLRVAVVKLDSGLF